MTTMQTATKPSATMSAVPPSATADLDKLSEVELVKRIKGELDEIEQAENGAKRTVVRHALILGELLIQAKSRSGQYGKWATWLKNNFKLSQKTAERYMNLKQGWQKVEQAQREGKFDTVSNLSFREVIKIIKPPPSKNPSDDYDGAQKSLIKKLEALKLDQAEAAVAKTKKELDSKIAAMKVAQFENMRAT